MYYEFDLCSPILLLSLATGVGEHRQPLGGHIVIKTGNAPVIGAGPEDEKQDKNKKADFFKG
jgi:hypothetical protein